MGCIEFLGPGDIVRPADQDEAFPSVPFDVSFHADEGVPLAMLDDRIAAVVTSQDVV